MDINLSENNWLITGEGASFEVTSDGALFKNSSDSEAFFRMVIPSDERFDSYIFSNRACRVAGSAAVLYFVDEYNHVLEEFLLNSSSYVLAPDCEEHALLLKVFPHSEVVIDSLSYEKPLAAYCVDEFLMRNLTGKVGVIVPTYPSLDNKYPCAFVHSRVQVYQKAGISCDVICAFDGYSISSYDFEGVHVLRIPRNLLSRVLRLRSYHALLVHFFDPEYAYELDKAEIFDTPIYLWSHTPETRYWDASLFATPYFCEPDELTDEQIARYKHRDEVIKRYNQRFNVSWIFVSEALKLASERLIGITFNRAYVIPNLVDEERFKYQEKDPSLAKKVFVLRKFENINTYALDIDMACIVELSKYPFFSEMEFDIYGAGGYYDELVAPVINFPNVHLHRRFLSHDEIVEVHKSHGIALFATRYDSQGVSMGEAALSGLAVVSSDIDAAQYFLPNDIGLLCDVEDPSDYARTIERLVTDSEYFKMATRACHDKIYSLCRREVTVEAEIALIKSL